MTDCIVAAEEWFIGEPIPVRYVGLRLTPRSPYINDATITVQMKRDGVNVGDAATLTYEADSNGNYDGAVPGSATSLFTDGYQYELWITSPNLLNRKIVGVATIRGRR